MIDSNYVGKIFDIKLSDVPEGKDDVVKGTYEVDLPSKRRSTIAVKITDMLGEELLVTHEV